MLEQKGSTYSRPPSRWEAAFPPLLAWKMIMKHMIQNPKVIEWLSKEGGGQSPVP
jgi:hypothetical protein